jgi:hypothetical protein
MYDVSKVEHKHTIINPSMRLNNMKPNAALSYATGSNAKAGTPEANAAKAVVRRVLVCKQCLRHEVCTGCEVMPGDD